jgi:sulfite reductase (NADPH) flavoprotein alpha-component
MAITERMSLAEGRPQRRKLFAAMAQQNCGQCGYLCESYADKLASGDEQRTNLCVPGGKDTSRMLKKLIAPASEKTASSQLPVGPAPVVALPAGEAGYSREQPLTAIFKSVRRLNADGSEKDTRHVVFDLSNTGLAYEPGDSFGLMPSNDPGVVDAVLAAMKAPAAFPVGGKSFREALISDYALGVAPDMLFEFASYMVGGARRQQLKALAKGQDPDGDAATFDGSRSLWADAPRSGSLSRMPRTVATTALFHLIVAIGNAG